MPLSFLVANGTFSGTPEEESEEEEEEEEEETVGYFPDSIIRVVFTLAMRVEGCRRNLLVAFDEKPIG